MIATRLKSPYEDVQLQFAGLNHMVWVHQVLQNGHDVTARVIDMLCDGAALIMNNIKEDPWQPDFLRAVGAIPCPYHRYFYQTKEMLTEEVAAAAERGTRAEQVMKVEKALFELYADPQLDSKPEQLSFRGGSYYSEVALELIRAIHNNLGTQLVVNTRKPGRHSRLAGRRRDRNQLHCRCARCAPTDFWHAAGRHARADPTGESL